MFSRKNQLFTLFSSMLLLACAPVLRADTQISYNVGGGATLCTVSPTDLDICPAIVGPPLAVQVTLQSNAPGTPVQSNEAGATVDIVNNSSTTQTITLYLAANGFLSPTTPPALTLFSHIGGTVLTGSAADLLSFTSCVDTSNTLPLVTCGAGTIKAPTVNPSITGMGSFSADSSALISSLGSPYALGESVTITLGAGADVNFSSSTTLTNVPEPASIALFGSGLFGLAGLIRRRK